MATKTFFADDGLRVSEMPGFGFDGRAVDMARSETSLFNVDIGITSIAAFQVIDYESNFVFPLPLVAESGELLVSLDMPDCWISEHPPMNGWLLSAQDSVMQALAMDFMLFMAEGVTIRAGMATANLFNPNDSAMWRHSGALPALGAARDAAALANALRAWYPSSNFRESPAEAGNAVASVLERAIEMPMRRNPPIPNYVFLLIEEEIGRFTGGMQTAEETARRLQERVTEAMRERE